MEDPADHGDEGSFDEGTAGLTQLLGLSAPAATLRAAYRAGELLAEFGIDQGTLRRYETLGLLHPTTEGGEPAYSSGDRARLRVALLGRLLGLSGEDILRLAEHYTPAETG